MKNARKNKEGKKPGMKDGYSQERKRKMDEINWLRTEDCVMASDVE